MQSGALPINPADERRVEWLVFGERELDDIAQSRERLPQEGSRCLFKLLSDIEQGADGAARQHVIRAAIQRAGFDWLCYWRIQCVGERVGRAACFDGYSPRGWLDDYRKNGWFNVDPRIGLARHRDWPFAWDHASLAEGRRGRQADPAGRHLATSAAMAGVRSGVTVGLPTGRASERAIVTLSSGKPDRRWMTDAVMGEAYAIALALHAFIDPRVRHLIADPESEALSEVQLAVLRFVSRGLSNREMAERLAISVHTVTNHLRQLERKYAARNRVQLAYIAGRILRR